MSCVDFRIISNNFVFDNSVIVTASSEDILFPSSNLKKFTRSKVWHSSGTFVITASNNKIDFKKVALGPQLTATITPGIYSVDGLISEIQTQLTTAAGSGTFTVSFSSVTGKWTITASSPITYFELLFSSGTNTLTSIHSVLGYVTSDLSGLLTYTANNIAIHTEESVVFDLLTTESINSFAIVFDPSLGINLTNSALIYLQANATNSWGSPSVNVTLSIDNDTDSISHFFATVQNYRYWRIKIIDKSNPDLYVELGKVILGNSLTISRIPQKGFNLNLIDRSKSQETEFGLKFFDVYPVQKALTISLVYMSPADIQTLYNMFYLVGSRYPIFISLDSQSLIFNAPKFMVYGYGPQNLQFTHDIRDLMSTSITIMEAF